MERLTFRAMGCEMLVFQERNPAFPDRMAEVPTWFADWEEHLSRFRDDSELSRLNRVAGQWTPVSPVLWEVVDAALRAAARSDGLVSPAVLPALEAAGYDRSFDLLRSVGAQEPADALRTAPPRIIAWWTIERDADAHALRLPPGMRLDLGGIAKGWAADQAAQVLGASGPALVNAGGDLAVSGPLPNDEPWTVGIADPAAPERDIEVLLVRRGGVATSGRDYRRWQQGGRWQHHIIDPRTGVSALTDVISATVVAPSAASAEVAAKVALIRGSRDGLAWLDAQPTLAGLLVLADGTVLRSRSLSDYLDTPTA